MKKSLPSQYYLRFHFEYDPETGVFSKNGKEIGSQTNRGYIRITIDSEWYLVHRLIWKYMTGEEPDTIDHINRDKLDNRWTNLRNVTQTINVRNRTPDKRGDGVNGVRYLSERGKWRVRIHYNGETHHIGIYTHALDAIQARIEAEEIFWKKFNVHTDFE